MPTTTINSCRYYYEEQGSGKETIVFSHGLLWSGYMFHKQVARLKDRYRVITYDHRGQGQSEVTDSGYDMDSLYDDAAKLIEELAPGGVHFAGLSMGGIVAMRLAARRPGLVRSIILMETSAEPEPNAFKYNLLNTIVKLFGPSVVSRTVLKIFFGNSFLGDPARKVERKKMEDIIRHNKKSIVKAVTGVIKRKGIENELKNIKCPVLIMVGTEDKATVPAKSEFIHKNIPQSKLVYIKDAGHTSCIEEPEQINTAIEIFLQEHFS